MPTPDGFGSMNEIGESLKFEPKNQAVARLTQRHRGVVLNHPGARTFRKTARIVAIQAAIPFTVETDRGVMQGKPGDWVVTNHPEDDGASDVWSISNERMQATYEEVDQ